MATAYDKKYLKVVDIQVIDAFDYVISSVLNAQKNNLTMDEFADIMRGVELDWLHDDELHPEKHLDTTTEYYINRHRTWERGEGDEKKEV